MLNKEDEVRIAVKSIIALFLVILLCVAGNLPLNNKIIITPTEDSIAFKVEYEELNSKDNNYGGKYKNVFVYPANPMKYATQEEVELLLTEGTGVIYFGFPECPWCRNALDGFLDATWDLGIDEVLYFNNKEERNILKLDENNAIQVEKEGTDGYSKILELLGDNASVYEGLNDESIKRLYFPTFVFVKDGEIVDFYEGTHPDVEDPSIEMDATQLNELKTIFVESFKKLK